MHGPIEFDGANIEDFVILRSDGHPTYHLSVVSDDVEMEITHVVRGDDHISNTPKQHPAVPGARCAGAAVRARAADSRSGQEAVEQASRRDVGDGVREQGYLPEAMVNFLALLGWSPGAAIGSCSRSDELVDAFSLDGISGGNAVFNPEKLDWFNQQHIDAAGARRARAARRSRRSRRPGSGTTSTSASGTRGSSPCSSC